MNARPACKTSLVRSSWLEALIEVWTEELVAGGKIELENLFVLEVQAIDRGEKAGTLSSGDAPRIIRQVSLRVSKHLKLLVNQF